MSIYRHISAERAHGQLLPHVRQVYGPRVSTPELRMAHGIRVSRKRVDREQAKTNNAHLQ